MNSSTFCQWDPITRLEILEGELIEAKLHQVNTTSLKRYSIRSLLCGIR